MVSLRSILLEVSALSPSERAELTAKLLEQAARELDAHEIEVGQRGLAAWTESARAESWEPFYPEGLPSARGTPP